MTSSPAPIQILVDPEHCRFEPSGEIRSLELDRLIVGLERYVHDRLLVVERSETAAEETGRTVLLAGRSEWTVAALHGLLAPREPPVDPDSPLLLRFPNANQRKHDAAPLELN